jgi:hypothetical protein
MLSGGEAASMRAIEEMKRSEFVLFEIASHRDPT